jgi:hypothetical protein
MLDQIVKEIYWFADACISAIKNHERFRNYQVHKSNGNIVQFTDGEFVVEFNYWPEDYPNLILQTNVGILRSHEMVGLWLLLSEQKIEDCISKQFTDEPGLQEVLGKLFQDKLVKHYSEIFNFHNIESSYSKMISDMDAEYEAEKHESLRARIISEFKHGNYSNVEQLVDSNKLLKADKRILKMYEYSTTKGQSHS